ncbi:MAG: hypothetical protein JWO51_3008 [Rhodospirillales bacterium]|nr:hypothetical protein [Rhodospirillales bacterium]
MHTVAARRFSLSRSLGLDCTTDGLTLAGVPLFRRTMRGFMPRDELEIRWLLERAYGPALDLGRILKGIKTIARALNEDQLGQASIRALLLDLPELDWASAVRLAQADEALAKFDPNEPRDEQGRWAANGNAPAAVHAPHGLPPKLSRAPLHLVSARPNDAADEARLHADTSSDDPETAPWVILPPGKRIDELADLLEWVANAEAEEAPIVRGEIRRLYYDHGDTSGGNALNLALTDALEATSRAERAAILERFEPYTREDPSQAAMDTLGLTLGVGVGRDLAAALEGAPAAQLLAPDRGAILFSTYFWREMGPVERGALLHEARTPRLASNFPIIDDERAGLVISTKTIDLSTPGYQNENRLRQVVSKYVKQLSEFNGGKWDSIEIKYEDIRAKRLDLIVPRHFSTESQWRILRNAASRARDRGVDLKITEF